MRRKHPLKLSSPHNTPPFIMPGNNDDGDFHTGTIFKSSKETKKPDMFKLLIINDDYTPMEFVVYVLETLFRKNREEATAIMLHVHNKGVGICGIYPYDIAETKAAQLLQIAQHNEHPLQCRIEKE